MAAWLRYCTLETSGAQAAVTRQWRTRSQAASVLHVLLHLSTLRIHAAGDEAAVSSREKMEESVLLGRGSCFASHGSWERLLVGQPSPASREGRQEPGGCSKCMQ